MVSAQNLIPYEKKPVQQTTQKLFHTVMLTAAETLVHITVAGSFISTTDNAKRMLLLVSLPTGCFPRKVATAAKSVLCSKLNPPRLEGYGVNDYRNKVGSLSLSMLAH